MKVRRVFTRIRSVLSRNPRLPMKSVLDQNAAAPYAMDTSRPIDRAAAQGRVAALVIAGLLMIGVIIATASLSSFTPHWGEFVKIIAVVMFVSSMLALALGMVGDAFRRR